MDNFTQINDELSAIGQVTPEDLRQAAQTGFRSVLNLRAGHEAGVLSDV